MNIIRRPFKYVNYKIVYWLIGINILIFAASQFFGRELRYYLMLYLSMIPGVIVQKKWIWTFITYMFMHGNITHIFFNMFGLLIFGSNVEKQMGSREFLLYYLLTGALAGVFSFGVYFFSNPFIPLIGASGAIFAVELAYAVLFPNSIIYIWGIIPLRAPVMVLGFTALELIFSVTGLNNEVAHLTHLAGFAMGWIYFIVRFGVNPWRRLTGHNL